MAVKRPHGRPSVVATFGDIDRFIRTDGTLSPSWETQNIRRVNLPQSLPLAGTAMRVTRIPCHKLLVDQFRAAIMDIFNAGKWSALGPYGGGFAFRPIRGGASVSLHAWGIAWDFDPENNRLGTRGSMDPEIVAIFEEHDFFWGGRFVGRKDPTHFQYATGT